MREILQSLSLLQPGFDKAFNFIPSGKPHPRHFCLTYTRFSEHWKKQKNGMKNFINTSVCGHFRQKLAMKQVVNTNSNLYLEKHKDKLVIISLTDNLIKGAPGQAVQNMI